MAMMEAASGDHPLILFHIRFSFCLCNLISKAGLSFINVLFVIQCMASTNYILRHHDTVNINFGICLPKR